MMLMKKLMLQRVLRKISKASQLIPLPSLEWKLCGKAMERGVTIIFSRQTRAKKLSQSFML